MLDDLRVDLHADRKRAQLRARLEREREGEAIRLNRIHEHPAIKINGEEGIPPLRVGTHQGVANEGGRVVWERIEDLLGVLEAASVGEGVEFGEAAGRVGVGGLRGLDHESMDLGGFLEVGAEVEEGEVGVRRRRGWLCH